MDLVLVHGFNVTDGGAATIDKLIPHLTDFNVIQFDYGWIGLLGVKLFGRRIARKLAKATPSGAVGIGHSNGCMELVRACEYGAKYKHLILINPALDNDISVPDHVDSVLVYHNVDDTTVSMARWMPFSYWGDMGRVGYTGNDLRFENRETKSLFHVRGNSSIFNKAECLARDIGTYLREY